MIHPQTVIPRLTRIRSYAIFKSRRFVHLFISSLKVGRNQCQSLLKLAISDLARQINSEVDSDGVQELLDSHNQDLSMDELIEMYEQRLGIEELESLNPVQSEDRVMVGNLTEGI
ncbi:hypothetical protein TNCV_4811561 [Trichonephila clavipes]|nr:hypothetical protein TNCV_4811561 [Trichonephila clavipes]